MKSIASCAMKVKVSGNKETLKIALAFAVVIFLICLIAGISYLMKTANYVEVSAEITDISVRYGNTPRNYMNRNKYVQYRYTYGQKEYLGERLTLLTPSGHIGRMTAIWIDPAEPTLIRNDLYFALYGIGFLIGAFVIVLVIKARR